MVFHGYSRPRGWADAQPVQPQGVAAGDPVLGIEGQEVRQGFFLAPVEFIALVFGNDQRQPGDLGGEIPQFDAPEIGEGDGGGPAGFAAPPVDLVLNGAHFLVGDHQKIARSTGGIKDPDSGHAVAQVQQFAGIVPGFLQLLP